MELGIAIIIIIIIIIIKKRYTHTRQQGWKTPRVAQDTEVYFVQVL